MFEIKGKRNTALCYAKVVEQEAIDQIRRMCDYPVTDGSRIRIMPDVHAGTGCTIGTTMTVTDKAVPNVVGVDIGCGMYTVNLGKAEIDFAKVDEAARYIPSGMQVWEEIQEEFDLTGLCCFGNLRDTDRLLRSLGTLGGGNHFIEIDRAADGTCYLVIHSGSRGLGQQVATFYQKLAVELTRGSEDYLRDRAALIEEYKKAGRTAELEAALKQLKRDFKARECSIPEDLCFLTGQHLADYLHDVEICQAFARRSRELMAEVLMGRVSLAGAETFHTIHNYIDTEEMILRKGAIAAHKGEKVLIPINMRDGSVLAIGKGNPEWNFSAPHGAGRIMSRTQAKQTLDLDAYRKAMEGVYTTSVSAATLDEAPMAYKSLGDIIDVIRDSVDVIEVMKPVYNFKADGEEPFWRKKGSGR
ncbi:MAG: RtcB family protein [Lachnospiraceae bacterium]|nr:RtcB family protein [Lachnospiraceae bacterium]